MAHLLKSCARWLHRTLAESEGESIVIHPISDSYGNGLSVPFSAVATIGKTTFSYDDGEIAHTWESRDFIVARSYFIQRESDNSPEMFYPPIRDWMIFWQDNGMDNWFRVFAPGDEPVWRWSDAYQTALRIHAKVAVRGVNESGS